MEDKNYQEDLLHIRKMMEKSSRFISLSGISGVFAGLCALLGAVYVHFYLQKNGLDYFNSSSRNYDSDIIIHLVITALVVMISAISAAAFFTMRKSKKMNLTIWDSSTRKLLIHFIVPMIMGGLFCLGLLYHGLHGLLSPTTLIFYGLALLSASNYTYSDIKYLGLCEIVLGLLSFYFIGYGLLFWAIGFGILHVIYGLVMYKKYG